VIIKTRRNGKYVDVEVEVHDVTIQLGLHDSKESKALAEQLQEAADDLLYYVNEERTDES
jgi:hypothetical protein